MDDSGHFVQFSTFKGKFNVPGSYKEFSKLWRATPQNSCHTEMYKLWDLKIGQVQISDKKCNNKAILNVFNRHLFHEYMKKHILKW